MSYLAIYRTMRPKTFSELVEQEHIRETLKNQIKEDRIGHAYLFSGTRGTGKTTTAKIFARAVNCESPVDGSPCGVCPACQISGKNECLDIVELDAASKNGVDDLRDLIDKVCFRPSQLKYKVYIIDEVHMLTISAFNALLKTLEEPPSHVIFILATTEMQKIPETILSRCMKFEFRLISTESIFEYIKKILEKSKIDFEEEAVYAIAKAGEGAMRDALSLLDVCLSISEKKLTFSKVSDLIGSMSRDNQYQIFECIKSKNAKNLMLCLDDILKNGRTVGVVTREMVSFMRDLVVVKLSLGKNLLKYPEEIIEKYTELQTNVSSEQLLRYIDVLTELEAKLKYSSNARTLLECALLKMTSENHDISIYSLARRINLLEKNGGEAVLKSEVSSLRDTPQKKKESENLEDNEILMEKKQSIAREKENNVAEDEGTEEALIRGKGLTYFRSVGDLMLYNAFSYMTPKVENGKLSLYVESKSDEELYRKTQYLDKLKALAESLGYLSVEVKYLNDNKGKEVEEKIKNAENLLGAILKIK